MMTFRLDIASLVTMYSQYVHDPRRLHLDVTNRILRHRKSAIWQEKLLFSSNTHLKTEMFTDTDWTESLITGGQQ